MKSITFLMGALAFVFAAFFATTPSKGQQPIFHVTVVESTISAVNYQYRQGPTEIDFRGTILMPDAKGEAIVESKRGRTEIDAHFEHVLPAQRFGREYLTYTLGCDARGRRAKSG
jgi:hypothetical protein